MIVLSVLDGGNKENQIPSADSTEYFTLVTIQFDSNVETRPSRSSSWDLVVIVRPL